MNFLSGLLLIACGILLIKYRYKIHNFTGEWTWAQRYLGGTVNAIVFIGGILIFFGVGYPFGVFDFLNSNGNIQPVSLTGE